LSALAIAFVACGGDDDTASPGDQQGTTTPTDGGQGDDGDSDGGNGDGAPADSRGSGTVTVDDQTFEFTVDACIVDDDSILIGGASSTADGQPVYVQVRSSSPFARAGVDVGIGSTRFGDVERGDEHYESAGYAPDADFIPPYITEPDLVVEVNGGVHISFTTPEVDFDETMSLEVRCQ